MALKPTRTSKRPARPTPATADLVRFGRVGLGPAAARAWVAEGVSPFEAEVFTAIGLGPDGARRILDAGVPALAYAQVAHREGLATAGIDAVLGRIETATNQGVTAQCWVPRVEVAVAERWWRHRCAAAMDPALPVEVQLSDLAEMLGASASKLSTMRRSHPGFPTPLSVSRSPRFSLAAVLDSEVFAADAGSISPSLLARMVVRTLAERVAVEAITAEIGDTRWNHLRRDVAQATAALSAIEFDSALRRRVERAIADDADDVVAMLEVSEPLPGADASLWRALGDALVAWMVGVGSQRPVHAGEVLDVLLMVIDEVAPPVTVATGPALARLMVDVTDLQAGHRVLDPGCGVGELLVAAVARAGYAGTYHGFEIDPDLAEVARVRLAARALDHEVRHGDWFDDRVWRDERYETVLVDPPLSEGIDDWVERAMGTLAPGGRVVVVARQSDLRPSGSIARRLEAGQVEAEVQIPHRARAEGRMPKYVVVLTRDGDRDRLPIREDLSAARITTSGGRVRTGPTSEQTADRLQMDTTRLRAALAERRRPAPAPTGGASRDLHIDRAIGRDQYGSGGPPEMSLAFRLISALRQRVRDGDGDQEAVRALLDALERFVRDDP